MRTVVPGGVACIQLYCRRAWACIGAGVRHPARLPFLDDGRGTSHAAVGVVDENAAGTAKSIGG